MDNKESVYQRNTKISCCICGKEINIQKQASLYFTDNDKPICEECWNDGRESIEE